MFGVVFGAAALVFVGGLSFAAGRMSVDEPAAAGPQVQRAAAQGQRDGLGVPVRQEPGGLGAGVADDEAVPAAQPQTQDLARAQDPADGDQASEGRRRGGQNLPGQFAGAIAGVLTSVGDLGFTLSTDTGESRQFIVDGSTAIVSEHAIDPGSVVSGELVRVQTADGSEVATLVTVLPAGSDLNQGPAGQVRAGGQGQTQQPQAGADGADRPRRGGGGTDQAGFGPRGVQGTVSTIEEGMLTVTLANGETQTLTTDPATSFVRQALAEPSQLIEGDPVRVQIQRGGFGGGNTTSADEPVTATSVTIVGPGEGLDG